MGTLIQSSHPIFASFPTEVHTEWQWWDILTASRAMVLNDLPNDFRPCLQVIDRYERNHKLGTIWEARVGMGRLLVTAIDFDSEPKTPVMLQLEHSIKVYLSSREFNPECQISLQTLDRVLRREP